jgi:2-C-methyl-D-erythritol 4-phosphate cytidylyltransferase
LSYKPLVSFLLFSGGVGARSGHHEPKQFYDVNGHPLIAYALLAANEVARVGEIIINSPIGFEDLTLEIAEKYCPNKRIVIVQGGATRHESSLLLTQAAQYDTVVLHEAARPFIDSKMILDLIECTDLNAGFCQPIPFSMCEVDKSTGYISRGIPRENAFNIQLPQKYQRETLMSAHKCCIELDIQFTEDAIMVVQTLGSFVRPLSGADTNLKVTTPNDFKICEILLRRVNE